MNDVAIFYMCFDHRSKEPEWQELVRFLPENLQETVNKQYHWQDRFRKAAGKLMLFYSLEKLGYVNYDPEMLQADENGRPYLSDCVDFNITHSGNYIICSISREGRIGVDVEYTQPVDLQEFRHILNDKEWNWVVNSSNPNRRFYHLWTLKESAAKVDGKGIFIPFQSLEIDHHQIAYGTHRWYFRNLALDEEHVAYITAEKPFGQLEVCEVGLEEVKTFALQQTNVRKLASNNNEYI
ncbi:4'-phosphopantetheinyl transferase superfamily protein [Fluviicola sp.]|uniref:4'-phosphopantetheinyl transferase family protein n=1 Tax=Fluviicola sp. TaxID=1917219 RepID=UPI00262AC165|nr:4'-phosphopantetheinyl transferase superfamily protein [Fluviicola sp.]